MPIGVAHQRLREDLFLDAAEVIEAQSVLATPIDQWHDRLPVPAARALEELTWGGGPVGLCKFDEAAVASETGLEVSTRHKRQRPSDKQPASVI